MKEPNQSAKIGIKSEVNCAISKPSDLSARIGVASLLVCAGAMLKPPNLSARIGLKLLGGAGAIWSKQKKSQAGGQVVVGGVGGGAGAPWRHFEATRHVSQDWRKLVVGRCWHRLERTKPIGVKIVVGRCGWHCGMLKQPNLSAKIGVKPLLGGAGAILK